MNIQRPARLEGFTLLELMITLAVAAILVVIVVPTYNNYVIRAHRSAAQQLLMDIAQRQEQFLLDNNTYASDITSLSVVLSPEVSNFYNAPVISLNSATAYTLSIQPLAGGQLRNDGVLVLSNTMQTCRSTNADSDCDDGVAIDVPWE